jgi:hypothetical protein
VGPASAEPRDHVGTKPLWRGERAKQLTHVAEVGDGRAWPTRPPAVQLELAQVAGGQAGGVTGRAREAIEEAEQPTERAPEGVCAGERAPPPARTGEARERGGQILVPAGQWQLLERERLSAAVLAGELHLYFC